jgi:hypothetical protein
MKIQQKRKLETEVPSMTYDVLANGEDFDFKKKQFDNWTFCLSELVDDDGSVVGTIIFVPDVPITELFKK